ncbi:MAG TPA: IS110 family transposase [Gemmatimonadales bacterium]|nr:IS110 family transposase [Gemmatimonadales bacterium]
MHPNVTAGLDLGDETSRVYVIDAPGQRVDEATVATTVAGLRRYFGGRGRWRVVVEVGTHSPWVTRELRALGHEVIVANGSEVYGRRRRRKRNDRLDAEFLARQGRADVALLHPIQHRSAAAQRDLALLRTRDQLVQARTKLINHVRGTVKAQGDRLPGCSAPAFARLGGAALPLGLQPVLGPTLDLIAALTSQIAAFDQQVAQLGRARYPEAARLQQIPGVGPLTALAFVLLIEDPTRFARSRDVGAYFGLVPRLDESSQSQPQLRISKAGDALGRRLLVSAAQYILGPFGPPGDLRRFGEAVAQRGGRNAKKRAVVAVARKLAVVMHRLWQSERAYDPERQRKRRRAA